MALTIDIWDMNRSESSYTLAGSFDTVEAAYDRCHEMKNSLQVHEPDEIFLITGCTSEGDDYDAHEPDFEKGAHQVRLENMIDDAAAYDEMRREMAMENGRLHGVEAYNDIMGY